MMVPVKVSDVPIVTLVEDKDFMNTLTFAVLLLSESNAVAVTTGVPGNEESKTCSTLETFEKLSSTASIIVTLSVIK